MRESADILGLFHDGSIVEINGDLPKISFRIEIEYLRNMFPSIGNSFLAYISGCESIEFYNWDKESRTKSLIEIQSEELEILSIEQKETVVRIICSTGELDIIYNDIEFQLDSGESVTYKELVDACNMYWDDWENRRKNST